jgi:hypothetical protein
LNRHAPPDEDRGCLGTYPSKGDSGGSPITVRDAPLMRTEGVLRNPPFKRVFCGKSDLAHVRPPDEDRWVLRKPPFKRGFWGKSDLVKGPPLTRTEGC